MTSTFEDSVLDFDINLFQQSSNNAVVQTNKEKVRKAIFISKRKIMSTDSLIRKFYDKRLGCRALERCILTSKEEYKEACIESMEYREKCTALEEEIKKLQTSNLELEEKFTMANNRYDGMQSHAKQLQQLVKENETQIESLKIEQKLEKANSKEQEKKFSNLQREQEQLIKNICSISKVVLGKKKLTKELKLFLTKYGTSGGVVNDCEPEEHCSDEGESFHTPMSPLSDAGECNEELQILTATKEVENKIEAKLEGLNIIEGNTPTRDDNDHDSECSNEVVSLDTGRGSSLAFSDSDKCFNSPEYFSQHSPLSAEVITSKDKVTIDIATSPIPIRQYNSVATSPVMFENCERLAEIEKESPSHAINCSCKIIKASSSMPTIMIDRVVSPIIVTHSVEKSTSPIKNATNDISVATSPLKLGETTPDSYNNDKHQNIQEKECLELNNSNYLEDENSNDGEIQMILDTMRFSQKLITPLPTTPAKTRTLQVTGTTATQTVLHSSMCPDAAKIKEENITLQATVAKLANDILNINNFLHKLSPLINNAAFMKTGISPLISNDTKATVNDTKIVHNQKPEHDFAQNHQVQVSYEMPSGIEKLDCTDRKSKLKSLNSLLFADSSPPIPSVGFSPPRRRAPKSLFSPTPPRSSLSPLESLPPPASSPPPAPATVSALSPPLPATSPPPVSPPPLPSSPPPASSRSPVSYSPPASRYTPEPPRLIIDTDHASYNDDYEDNNNVKTKETLQFEEPLSNLGILSDEALSDHDIYEHEIVIELGPDCLESDTNSLHEILKEQVSKELMLKEKQPLEEKNIKKLPKMRKTTKLEKLRKKMMPKSKIKKVDILSKRNKRIQPKRLSSCKERLKSDTFTDNKAAYEKACKVMAEIKSKEEVDRKRVVARRLPLSRKRNAVRTSKATHLSTTSNQLDKHENNIVEHSQSVVHDGLDVITSENSPPQCTENLSSTVVTNKICNIYKNVQDLSKQHSKPLQVRQSTDGTRCHSKSISNDNSASLIQDLNGKDLVVHNKEVSFDLPISPQPLSPSQTRPVLKMYGRNRNKTNNDGSLTSSKNISVSNFEKPYIPTVVEEIKDGRDTVQSLESRKRLKRPSVDKPDLSPKRMLRSTAVLHSESEITYREPEILTEKDQIPHVNERLLNYDDLDMFNESSVKERQNGDLGKNTEKCDASRRAEHPKFGILCAFLDKYGRKSQKSSAPRVSENVINTICKKLEDDIREIQKLSPKDSKQAMDKLVQDLQSWKQLQLLSGLIKYLKDPERKIELYNKVNVPPAPPMTKAEQILIYVVSQLKVCSPNIVESILKNIEYSLFMLNRTPEFDAIETLSHFYAILCRYDKNRNRLRLFIIDAMYCLQYKAVPLIKQCLEVWMHILPLAHMGIAKNPLVTCLVYLLHFYKCEDRFNRVQEIRNILNRKYFYEMSEWNETRILEMFRTSIIELRDIAVEKKMLRMALIVVAKRHGARWCQNYIVKNMLLPIMEQAGVPERVKCFCVSLLGPLLKPYPIEMKVNCEIVMNQLSDMLNRNPSKQMEEAIFTSLIYMSRHNQNRVIKALLFWKPENVSSELEDLLKCYVKERPMKSWKTVLSKINLQHT